MCNCITNELGEKEFCSILCRDYYLGGHPNKEWKYNCRWCSYAKTLKPASWCSDKCLNNDIDANIKLDLEKMNKECPCYYSFNWIGQFFKQVDKK